MRKIRIVYLSSSIGEGVFCLMETSRDVIGELAAIVGPENVLTEPSHLACYSVDFSRGVAGAPEVVVLPKERSEVGAVVRLAYRHRIPVVPRGSGTSVTGAPIPVSGGLVLDLSRLRRVLSVDVANMSVLLEPGVIWAELNKTLAEHNLFSPSSPGSGRVSTLGGSLASGGSGMRSLKYGTVREQVAGMSVVLPGGEEVWLGYRGSKTACGYDLKDLFIGSEGTLGVITEIAFKVWPKPPFTLLVEADLDRLENAFSVLTALRRDGLVPSAYELVPAVTFNLVGEKDFRAEGRLLAEFQGSGPEVAYAGQRLRELLGEQWVREWAEVEGQMRRWREESEIYFNLVRLKNSPVAEDIGVPVREVPRALRLISDLFQSHGVKAGLMSHAGDGTIHCVLAVDEIDPDEWKRAYNTRAELYRLVLSLGGTITAEHGLGLSRAPFAGEQLGPALALMRRIKLALDPENLMNPGKMVCGRKQLAEGGLN